MSLNWMEIDAVVREMDLAESRIQKVTQPSFQTLVFQIYSPGRRKNLLISLEASRTRIHETASVPRGDIKLQRFCQFLRSRLVGGAIVECRQIGQERIVRIAIDRSGEKTNIYARLWGGAANVIATDEHQSILDAFYRRPNRNEVSGGSFDPEEIVKAAAATAEGRAPRKFTVRSFPGGGSLSERIELYYDTLIESEDAERLRAQLAADNERDVVRLEIAIERKERAIEKSGDGSRYRRLGDLLSSSLHRIKLGDSSVSVPDYAYPETEVVIEIDPGLRPGENADKYYRKYKSAKKRVDRLRVEGATLRQRLAEAIGFRATIEAALTADGLRKLKRTHHPAKKQTQVRRTGGLTFYSSGYEIRVGRTARENDELLRSMRGNDYWLHARDFPGAYVFVRSIPSKSIPLEILVDAGNLALYYSRAKGSGQSDLYYTQVKNLRRPRDARLGLVIPTQEKNLFVRLDESRIQRLKDHMR